MDDLISPRSIPFAVRSMDSVLACSHIVAITISNDIAILQNVVAANYGISKTDLERLRGICVNEVKKINGSITFDEAIRWQS